MTLLIGTVSHKCIWETNSLAGDPFDDSNFLRRYIFLPFLLLSSSFSFSLTIFHLIFFTLSLSLSLFIYLSIYLVFLSFPSPPPHFHYKERRRSLISTKVGKHVDYGRSWTTTREQEVCACDTFKLSYWFIALFFLNQLSSGPTVLSASPTLTTELLL